MAFYPAVFMCRFLRSLWPDSTMAYSHGRLWSRAAGDNGEVMRGSKEGNKHLMRIYHKQPHHSSIVWFQEGKVIVERRARKSTSGCYKQAETLQNQGRAR
jgi:hypothetical protein